MEKNSPISNHKIVITGSESCGKSTVSKMLAEHFGTIWLPEYAREYLTDINRPYEKKDLLQIAYGQNEREKRVSIRDMLHFVDTSFEVLKVWSEWKYGTCDPQIIDLFENQKPDLYLLMSPDLPWEEDELRETPNDRQELFKIYKRLIKSTDIQYYVINGEGETRIKNAVVAVREFLNLQK